MNGNGAGHGPPPGGNSAWQTVIDLMAHGVRQRVFPGAVLLAASQGRVAFHRAFGVLGRPDNIVVTPDAIFDLASLTKPLATTLALLYLADRGALDFTRGVNAWLPELTTSKKGLLTPALLLVHRSGLPAYRPYYRQVGHLGPALGRAALRQRLAAEPLARLPDTQTIYSDLGFMLLHWLVERISGQPMERLLADTVYPALGIDADRELFFPVGEHSLAADSVAATEYCRWRRRVCRGEVHDENAWAQGRVAGHAGLFGTAMGVCRLLLALMDIHKQRTQGAPLIAPDYIRQCFAPALPGRRPLGFDTITEPFSAAGKLFSKDAVGHLGFTGTSFWLDPKPERVVVLLTNRVHFGRDNRKIHWFRPVLHDAVMRVLKRFR